ncbi:MAG: LamG domain-containing protein, partial [Anaerolineales bacterium]|nr:LamG domain-containing protein [Anaerolineales bacterium]
MWTMGSVADASIKRQNLTNNNSVTFASSGVRGLAANFVAASSMSLTDADHADYTFGKEFSAGLWFYRDLDSGADEGLLEKFDSGLGTDQSFQIQVRSDDLLTFYTDTSSGDVTSAGSTALSTGRWYFGVATYDGVNHRIYLNGELEFIEAQTGNMDDSDEILIIGGATNGDTPQDFFDGKIDEVFITAEVLTPAQIKHMYETGKKSLQNHTASKISGITSADDYQELYGTTNIVTAVTVDEQNGLIYVGTNDGSNNGGVSAIGIFSDTIEDAWATGISKLDDDGTAWGAEDIVAIGVTGRYPSTIAIATDAEFWIETESFSFDAYRSQTENPHGQHLVQTALSVKQDLEAGEEFTVWGSRVLGEQAQKPTFKVAQDGTVSVREELVLRGHTDISQISNINDVFVYDTTKDIDGGAWTNNTIAKASSWYNEPIDASSQTCDIIRDDRCGSRAFPQKAVIVATDTNAYIFDAKDNTMWMMFEVENSGWIDGDISGALKLHAIYALNGTMYAVGDNDTHGELATVNFKTESIKNYSADATFGTSIGVQHYKGNVADRNGAKGVVSLVTPNLRLISTLMNDVQVVVIDGKTYVVVSADGGVSIFNETDGIVVDGTRAGGSEFVTKSWVTESGELYIGWSTDAATSFRYVSRFNEIPSVDFEIDNENVRYDDGTNDLVPNIQSQNNFDLFVTEKTSFVDGISNTIYVGSDEGLTKLSENTASSTQASVKYYTKDYITEEMIGDIRGMWTFDMATSTDQSIKANTLNGGSGISTADWVPGVRGKGLDFDGTEHLERTGDSDFSFGTGSFAASIWLKSNSATNPGTAEIPLSIVSTSGVDRFRPDFDTDG